MMRPIMKPKGAPPESTPPATSAAREMVEASPLAPPELTPELLNVPPPWVIGRLPADTRLPTLTRLWSPNRFHCTPRSRPALRAISMKRTSSSTCCGCDTATELMMSGPN